MPRFPLSRLLSQLACSAVIATAIPAQAQQPAEAIGQMLAAAQQRADNRISAIRTQLGQNARNQPLDETRAKQLGADAMAAARRGDNETAQRLWQDAQQADAANPAYAANSALVYLKMKLPAEAIKASHAALALDPANMRIWFNLGRAYAANNMLNEAMSSFYLAVHFSDDPDTVRDQLRAQAASAESSVALSNASRMALTLSANKASKDPAALAASRVKLAPDIENYAALALSSSERFDLSKPGVNKDGLYKEAQKSYIVATLLKREETYYQNAAWGLKKSAALGHIDAPGLLGIILAEGYTRIGGAKAAPDLAEARRLFELSGARGGSMGLVGLGDLAYGGKGEPVNARKALDLYEKAAAAKNEVAARRLIQITLESRDGKMIAAANASLMRAGVDPVFIASVVHGQKAGMRDVVVLMCAQLEDDHANALRRGDRDAMRYVRAIAGQLSCRQ